MKIKFGDIIIAIIVGAVAAGLLLSAAPSSASEDLTAVVLVDGVETWRIDLNKIEGHEEIDLETVNVVIEVENGRIAFKSSSCPDKTCIHTGWLKNAGDISVCIPNKVIVKIEGTKDSDVDIIAE